MSGAINTPSGERGASSRQFRQMDSLTCEIIPLLQYSNSLRLKLYLTAVTIAKLIELLRQASLSPGRTSRGAYRSCRTPMASLSFYNAFQHSMDVVDHNLKFALFDRFVGPADTKPVLVLLS